MFQYNTFGNIKELVYFTKLTSISGSAFAYSTVASLVVPEFITSAGSSSFRFTRCGLLDIRGNFTSIPNYTSNVSTLIVRNTTPPTLTVYSNLTGANIYVPAESLDAYKAATQWSRYAANMHTIEGSEYDG